MVDYPALGREREDHRSDPGLERMLGAGRPGNPEASKSKIKFDRQIVAAVEGATAVYSDDDHVRAYAVEAGLTAHALADLPEPPDDPQSSLPLSPPE